MSWVLLILEKEMVTHSSILAWRVPWTEEPGRLQSMGSDMTEQLSLSLLIVPFYRWGNKATDRLSNKLKTTKLASGRAKIWI